jgi:hypothetical protein
MSDLYRGSDFCLAFYELEFVSGMIGYWMHYTPSL